MDRRAFVVGSASLVAAPLAAFGQQPAGRMRRIGFLGLGAPGGFHTAPLEAFRAGMKKLGHIEGKTVAFEYKFASEKRDHLPGLAAELVRSRVDVILTHGTPETRAAKEATTSTPIVMASVGDPVGAGFVPSLARPGGNITGLTNIDVGLAAKRLDLLKQVVPNLARVAALRNPTNPSGEMQYRDSQGAAKSLGIEILLFDVREAGGLEDTFAAMVKARAGALAVMADPLFLSRQKLIAGLALASRLPSVFGRNENVEAGGLMSYGPTLIELYRHAATYVDKILRGANPGDLPIEQPTKFELVINLRTAKALGLAIPRDMRFLADRVIE